MQEPDAQHDYRDDRWSARVESGGLMVIGAIVTIIILIFLVPRILAWLGSL